jgi:hypothetical protein
VERLPGFPELAQPEAVRRLEARGAEKARPCPTEAEDVGASDQLAVPHDQGLVQVQVLAHGREVAAVGLGIRGVPIGHLIPSRNGSIRRHAERQRDLLARRVFLARVAAHDPGRGWLRRRLKRRVLIGAFERHAGNIAVQLVQAEAIGLRALQHERGPGIGQMRVHLIQRPPDPVIVERGRGPAVDFLNHLGLGPRPQLANRRWAHREPIQDQHLDDLAGGHLALLARSREGVERLRHTQAAQVRIGQGERADRLGHRLDHFDVHSHLPLGGAIMSQPPTPGYDPT